VILAKPAAQLTQSKLQRKTKKKEEIVFKIEELEQEKANFINEHYMTMCNTLNQIIKKETQLQELTLGAHRPMC